MFRYHGYKSLQEAEDKASKLLCVECKDSKEVLIKFYEMSFGKLADSFKTSSETPFAKPIVYDKEDCINYAKRIDSETGDRLGGMCIVYKQPSESYSVFYLSPEELNPCNYTIPFRNLTEEELQILAVLPFSFCKPTIALSPDEALSPNGASILYRFEGKGYESLTEEELRDKKSLFLSYATYEFFRTETYSHLLKVLSLYKSFGLSENWARGYYPLEGAMPEEYVIKRYLAPATSQFVNRLSNKELSAATGIPRTLLNKVKLW